MTVKQILSDWLRAHGYDGLYGSYGECGCLVGDLMPCDGSVIDCEPGYRAVCDPKAEDRCEACADGGWHVQAERPAPEKP